MSSRIIAALLASVGFLATFAIRSWHADLWHARQPNYELVSALPHPVAVRRASIAASAPASPSQRQSPAPKVRAGRRLEVATSRTPYLVTLSDAQAFLSERAREADHSGRAR